MYFYFSTFLLLISILEVEVNVETICKLLLSLQIWVVSNSSITKSSILFWQQWSVLFMVINPGL